MYQVRVQQLRYRLALLVATGLALLIVAPSCAGGPTPRPIDTAGTARWVTVGEQRIKTRVHASRDVGEGSTLVLALHGDRGGRATYVFSRRAAAAIDNVVVAAVVRPGYTDEVGDRSDGERGLRVGDNYTAEVVDVIAEVISDLKASFGASRVVVVGHSGGAAITAALLGRHPAAIDGALLVACPCDVAAWRRHMHSVRGRDWWLGPVDAVSPITVAEYVSRSVRVRMIVGSDDQTTPEELTVEYAEALQARTVDVAVTIAPGLGHNILLEPIVLAELQQLIASLNVNAGR
jgi:pimeloyl-ACP methyl ester carboxylesterase